MNMSNLNLNEFFSSKFFYDQRWSIAGQGWAPWDSHDHRWLPGIVMTIDGPPGNAMTIGELHWSLSTGTTLYSDYGSCLHLFDRNCQFFLMFYPKVTSPHD